MINKSKILGSTIFPLVLGTSLFSNRIHMNNEILPAPISSYKRTILYPENHIKKVNTIYDWKEIRGEIKKQIQKDRLEKELKNISLNTLNDYFKKNSWNFNNLKGRIYYKIQSNNKVKASIFWNNLPNQNNFRFFDQWNIVFK